MSSPPSPTGSPNPVEPPLTAQPDKHVSWLVRVFASGIFSGYSPVASGTVASALALAVYFIPGFEHPYVIMPACFFLFILGTKAAGLMEERYGHDPAEVTVDEILGMWISVIFLPKALAVALPAFFLFRLFDIIKPWPARKFDDVHGGLGIMLDDVIAGIYTNLVMHLAVRFGLPELLPF